MARILCLNHIPAVPDMTIPGPKFPNVLYPLILSPICQQNKWLQKNLQALIPGSGRENITVQTCISASGQPLFPYVVYKHVRL